MFRKLMQRSEVDKDSMMSMSGSEFVEMFVGMGVSKVRDLFRQAKEKVPCIAFNDIEQATKLDELSQYLFQREVITGKEFMRILNS